MDRAETTAAPLAEDFLLSVVVPVYNEATTLAEAIRRVRESGVPCEIVLVDDGSTDGSRELLERLRGESDLTILFHETNRGKGAALRTGFAAARGHAVVVQDADLEYDPSDLGSLIAPIVEGRADVVYGSRFAGGGAATMHRRQYWANRALTALSNWRSGLALTDMETCYKMIRQDVLARIAPSLVENRFGIEPELTARLARLPGVRIVELPISYRGRDYAQGKKIGWRDAIRAAWCIWRYS